MIRGLGGGMKMNKDDWRNFTDMLIKEEKKSLKMMSIMLECEIEKREYLEEMNSLKVF